MRQSVLTLETNKYKIKIENFEGPLDLLCHLIDINKMDIYDVNINEITDQYIEYINTMKEMDLEITSEFLLMASNLLYIKSKKLLPRQDVQDEMLTEEELIQRIVEYKKYKEITNAFNELLKKNNKRIYKSVHENIMLPELDLNIYNDYNDLSIIYKKLLENNKVKMNKNSDNIEKIAIIEHYSVGDTVKTMFKELIRKSHFIFNKLFAIESCNSEQIVTAFSGLLEMSKRSKIETKQDRIFGDIEVTKKKVIR